MKKSLLFFFVLSLFSCKNEIKRDLPSGDILELPSTEINLSIPETQEFVESEILNLSIPSGKLDEFIPLKISTRIPQNIILKIIIPYGKGILFNDISFLNSFEKKIENEIIKCNTNQIKLNSIIFVIEDEKEIKINKNFFKFIKKLKNFGISIGLGIPLFSMDYFQKENFKEIDYFLIFAYGFPYPPTKNQKLLAIYRAKTKEKNLISFNKPFYFGISLENGIWISSGENLNDYFSGFSFNSLTENPAIEFLSINLNSGTINPQFIFEANKDTSISNITIKKNSGITFMLFSYDTAKEILGRQSKHLNSNYLGRYYYCYYENYEELMNFSTWLSYLKAKPLNPLFDLRFEMKGGGYVLKLSNLTGLYTDYSIDKNFLEWEFGKGYFNEAELGEWKKFRFLYGEEEVLPFQADKIRFYEDFIGPFETISTGAIRVNGGLKGVFRVAYTTPGGHQITEILRME